MNPLRRSRKSPPGVLTAFVVLLSARLASACLNIVHDCDEVYNYWEPLHFLLYGHGMQTWEYRCVWITVLEPLLLDEPRVADH